MPLYGKIALNAGVEEFVEEVRHDTLSPDMIRKLANGRPALRPITAVNDPPFDLETEKLGPPIYTISPTDVQRSRETAPLTSGELKARAALRLAATDEAWLAALEALVDLLISKGVIALADLPQRDRDVLAARKALRVQL